MFPDWLQIAFNGSKIIDRVVVYTVQDNYANPIEPTDTLTFSLWGITAFTVQGWNGLTWVTLATVTGNNLVKRSVTFAAYTTDRIRINVTDALGGSSRIAEVEAWGGPGAGPVVSLTAPTNNATYTAPASVTISANASDSDGTISHVEFYWGSTLLGNTTSAPYSFNWANVPAGNYSLSARAIPYYLCDPTSGRPKSRCPPACCRLPSGKISLAPTIPTVGSPNGRIIIPSQFGLKSFCIII